MDAAYWAGNDNATASYERPFSAVDWPASTPWVLGTANTGLLNNFEVK